MAAHLTGDAGGPPPPTRNEELLCEVVYRLHLQLDAAREVTTELGPLLESIRAMHGPGPGTDHPSNRCGWCRLIVAYDKFTDETAIGGK